MDKSLLSRSLSSMSFRTLAEKVKNKKKYYL